jgi:hypothetical protein
MSKDMELRTMIHIIVLMALVTLAYGYALFAFADTYQFNKNLTIGSIGQDVQNLQRVLNGDSATRVSESGAGSAGQESTYFGLKTKDAVIRFQRKYSISPAAGFVGPLTRSKLNSLDSSVSSSVPEPAKTASATYDKVCNESLIGSDGYDERHMIDKATCRKLNDLYAAGKAAGNAGDLYVNRDNLHVNFCVGWTPNPDCPLDHRLFYQHDWKISGGGAAGAVEPKITLGQASYSGSVSGDIKHSIVFEKYKTQTGADQLYAQYAKSNLFFYPSLYEDSYKGSAYETSLLANPADIDKKSMNTANTPYVVGTKQICECGADSLRIHDASGSELALIELGFAGLAAFKPEVKEKMRQGVTIDGERVEMVVPTLQALMRYAHRSVVTQSDYLSSAAAHGSSYTAHYLKDGAITPAYSALELVETASSVEIADVPPLVRLAVISETFKDDEKIFTTPGAISRSVAGGTSAREITISAEKSVSLDGTTGNLEYTFVVLGSGSSQVKVAASDSQKGRAKIEFTPGSSTERIDVGVFVKKTGGKYYSVPGIVSLYVRG